MISGFRPEYSTYHPALRTRSLRRARLFAGGTYFRAREPSAQGNNISIEVLEFLSEIPGEEELLKGKLIITNHNTVFAENVSGPATVDLLDQHLNWNERFVIENLDTVPRMLRYNISLQTVVAQSLQEDLGIFAFSRLFHLPGKLSVKLSPVLSGITPGAVITIKPRTRVYDLERLVVVTPPTGDDPGGTTSGWDIAALRTAMENDPWVQMMERSGTPANLPGAPSVPPLEKFDVQDNGVDADFLTPFPDTYLTGGDGLPDFPVADANSPAEFMIHVNFTEQPNGTVEAVYDMYEWVGDTASGEWKRY